MSYKSLHLYKNIFSRHDYNYISDTHNIEHLLFIIKIKLRNPDGALITWKNDIHEYLKNLHSFYTAINTTSIPSLNEGYALMISDLQKVLSLFDLPNDKREHISKGYAKKYNKLFIHGLSLFTKGILTLCSPAYVYILQNKLVANYLVDKKVGFGKRYIFDEDIYTQIANNNFSKQVLSSFLKSLDQEKPVRNIGNGWTKYGQNTIPFRAYTSEKSFFSKPRVYFLIPNTPAKKRRVDALVRSKSPKDVNFHSVN
jgi:hypothetical protein